MTFTGDELILYVWLPLVLSLFGYMLWLERKYGLPGGQHG